MTSRAREAALRRFDDPAYREKNREALKKAMAARIAAAQRGDIKNWARNNQHTAGRKPTD